LKRSNDILNGIIARQYEQDKSRRSLGCVDKKCSVFIMICVTRKWSDVGSQTVKRSSHTRLSGDVWL